MADTVETVLNDRMEGICAVTEDNSGNLYVISDRGNVSKVENGSVNVWFNTGGQPSFMQFDVEGTAYICDQAHQSIFCTRVEDSVEKFDILVKQVDGKPLLGPSSTCIHEQTGMIYFTDSGPAGETTIEKPKGSVFSFNLDTMKVSSVISEALAFPYGIAATQDGRNIYISELYENRILRLFRPNPARQETTVFTQLNGRLGPSALALSSHDTLYAAHYDLEGYSDHGVILCLGNDGLVINKFILPNGPEISSILISR